MKKIWWSKKKNILLCHEKLMFFYLGKKPLKLYTNGISY